MKPKGSKALIERRKLSKEQMLEEHRCKIALKSSWALQPGETIVDKAEREARAAGND